MSLAGLSTTLDYPNGYRPPERRPAPEILAPAELAPTAPADPAPGLASFDASLYASRFKADLTRLTPPAAEPEPEIDAVSDFFGNLGALLIAVRAGDLPRARSAADALEMEVLVERSAGRRPQDKALLDDLGRLFVAAQAHDEADASAAAARLTGKFRPLCAPAAPREPGAAAYETLAHYFDADAPTS